jgi:hypothetical protein
MVPNDISGYAHILSAQPIGTGDIAIFGVYNGKGVAEAAKRFQRTTYAFDTFEGLPSEEYMDIDSDNPPGKFVPEHNAYEWLLYQPLVKPLKGRFLHTLPLIPAETKFGYVYLDADYYKSYKQVLDYLDTHNHWGENCLIITDDYYHLPAVKQAMDEWTAKHGLQLKEGCWVRWSSTNKQD